MSEVEYWDGTGVTPVDLEVEVRRLAAEQPEHVYDKDAFPDRNSGASCKYTHTLEDDSKVPGCIVGVAIHNITGKLVDQSVHAGGVLDFGFMRGENTTDDNGYRHWSPIARFLGNVQTHQDHGVAWGEAVRKADDHQDSDNWFQGFGA
jgi:hypothetical protein